MKSDGGRIHGLTYRIGRHVPGQHAQQNSNSLKKMLTMDGHRKLCFYLR